MNITDIEATLKYGKFVSKRSIKGLCVGLSATILIPLLTVFLGISLLLGKVDWSNDMLGGLLFGNIFCIFLFGVFLYLIIINTQRFKEVENYLLDAINLKAYVVRLDILNTTYKPYQIQVKFEFQGKNYNHISISGDAIFGYNKCFGKYDNKMINILYSPKYDQVMVLKESKS